MAVAQPYFTKKGQVNLKPGYTLGFAAGKGYYAKPNPVVAVAPRTAPPAAPVDPYTAQAKAIAATMIDPQVDVINRAAVQAQQDAIARAKAYEGVTTALGTFTAGMPEAVRSAYSKAGADVSGYATGITGQAGENARSAAAEAAAHIASLGAPGSISANPNYENTVAITGGLIPARTLAEQAASHMAEMTGLRTASGLSLAQAANEQASKDSAAVAELRAKAVDLEGTRAGEVAKALLQLHDQARLQQGTDIQARALQVQEGQLQLSRAKTAQDEAQAMTNITGTIWVVRGGKAVDTHRVAPGTAGYRAQHPAAPAPAHLQSTNIGGHPVTYDPNTGAYYQPGSTVPVTQAQITQWLKKPIGGGSNVPSSQSKTLPDGTVVDYNPKAPAGKRYTDPTTGKVVDPNAHKAKPNKLTPDEVRTKRAKASADITATLNAHKDYTPEQLLKLLVAEGIPNWIAVWAIRREAANHKGVEKWDNTHNANWTG